jgi:phage terminase large subunit-like protein
MNLTLTSGSNPFDQTTHPNCYRGHQYAEDVVSGKITANIWIKGACQRYLRDIVKAEEDENCPFYFMPGKAEKFLRVVQKFNHPVGFWKTKNIVYEPWQCFAWMNVKGFYSHKTNMIRFRTAHIDVARGNAKSTMASQATLYELCCDNPNGNRIYCAATSRDQAKEVLNGAQIMARGNESFRKNFGVDVRAHEVLHDASNSYIKAISAQANSLDGKIGVLIITDELHAMQRKTFEVLDSGQSKRNDSLLLSITTAGYANDGVGFSQRKYAQKVALGEIEDDTFFALVYRLDEDDTDIFDEKVWIKANPNLGVSVDIDNFRAKAKKAKENPEDSANFKIKHLNMYLDSLNQLLDVPKWKALRDKTLTLEDFKGKRCYVGIDVATKIDITSVCYMFYEDGIFYPFWKSFIPEARVAEVKNRNYLTYIAEGDLTTLPGEVVNLPAIEDILIADSKIFKFIEVYYDPWGATEMATRLLQKKLEMVEFRMVTSNLSEPTKKYQANIIEGIFRHNTGEMLEWCTGNLVGKYDAVGNIFPRKDHEDLKIDPLIAAIMALAGHIKEMNGESVYEQRGIRVL